MRALVVAAILSGCASSSVAPGAGPPRQAQPAAPAAAPAERAGRAQSQPPAQLPADPRPARDTAVGQAGAPAPAQPGPHADAPRAGVTGPVPASLQKEVDRIAQLQAEHDLARAAQAIEALIAAHPEYVKLHLLRCDIESERGGPEAPDANAACDRAIALAGDAETVIAVSDIRQRNGDEAGSRATLAGAGAVLDKLPPARASAGWLALADHYRDREMVTSAEDALASARVATDDRGIAAWAATLRVRFGLPRDGARYKLVAADDFAALSAVRDVLGKVNRKAYTAALASAEASERRWPGLPGLLAARCRLALDRGALGAARQLCDRSLAAFESSLALQLSAAIELRAAPRAAPATAIARLRKAIALDPELVDAWDTLAGALDRGGAITELDQLRFAYRAQFRKPPPW